MVRGPVQWGAETLRITPPPTRNGALFSLSETWKLKKIVNGVSQPTEQRANRELDQGGPRGTINSVYSSISNMPK